uniref:Uncharacterized protein n=1 Tax=Arundo donax TaxID=35708 RepID=A0A0A9FED6_ARUDO
MTAGSSSRSLESCFICMPNDGVVRYGNSIRPKAFHQGWGCLYLQPKFSSVLGSSFQKFTSLDTVKAIDTPS